MVGTVTCQKLYNLEIASSGIITWGKHVWANYIHLRRSFFLLKILHKRLATEEEVQARGIQLASSYRFCFSSLEMLDHLFLSCPFSKFLWTYVMEKFGVKAFSTNNFAEFFSEAMSISRSPHIFTLWKVFLASIYDIIWSSRN